MSQVRANSITNSAGSGAPDFPNGLTNNGVTLIGVPSGAVAHFAMNTAPTGWLKANGALVSRTTYANLFAAIGTTFGAGDGSTTFALPDLRGYFSRNWDDGRGIDSGRSFGSLQATRVNNLATVTVQSGFDSDSSVSVAENGNTSLRLFSGANASPAWSHRFANRGGDTYPGNIALLACIKF